MVGTSRGGVLALPRVLGKLPASYPAAVIAVLHRGGDQGGYFERSLANSIQMPVGQPIDKEPVLPGIVYLAPGGLHLLVDAPGSFAYSLDERVNYSRPSVDVLFTAAADVYGSALAAIVLTGEGADGALGLAYVAARGGHTAVQDPDSALAPAMPRAALERTTPDVVLDLPGLGDWLVSLEHLRHPTTRARDRRPR